MMFEEVKELVISTAPACEYWQECKNAITQVDAEPLNKNPSLIDAESAKSLHATFWIRRVTVETSRIDSRGFDEVLAGLKSCEPSSKVHICGFYSGKIHYLVFIEVATKRLLGWLRVPRVERPANLPSWIK